MFFEQHPHHAQSMATQCEWVFFTGRLQADAPNTDQGFKFVGNRGNQPDLRRRQFVTGKTRLIMLSTSRSNVRFFTMMRGVIAPHHALQLREFTHHVADQIGLGDVRGTFRIGHIRAQLLSQIRGNRLHTRHARALRAELVVVNHALQFADHLVQTAFFILLKEELRIGQTRAHHACITLNDLTRIVSEHIRYHQKFIDQGAFIIGHGKVFLIGLHGQNQALLRYRQEFRFKFSFIHHRIFGQRIHLVEQGLRHDDLIRTRFVFQLLVNAFATHFVIRLDHTFGAQNMCVFMRIRNIDRSFTQKAVTIGHAIGFHAKCRHRQHIRTVQRQQTFDRADELHILLRRRTGVNLISHDLRNRQFRRRIGQNTLQHFRQDRAFLRMAEVKNILLAIVFDFQIGRCFIRKAHRGELFHQ